MPGRPQLQLRWSDRVGGTSGSSQSTAITCSSWTDCERPATAASTCGLPRAERIAAAQIRGGTGSAAISAACSSPSSSIRPLMTPSATATVCTLPPRARARPASALDEPSSPTAAVANRRDHGPWPIRSRSVVTASGRPSSRRSCSLPRLRLGRVGEPVSPRTPCALSPSCASAASPGEPVGSPDPPGRVTSSRASSTASADSSTAARIVPRSRSPSQSSERPAITFSASSRFESSSRSIRSSSVPLQIRLWT